MNNWTGAREDFDLALTVLPDSAVTERAALLNRLGFAMGRRGDMEDGLKLLSQALELAVKSGDRRTEARVHGNIGALAHTAGDPELATRETLAAMLLCSV